MDNSTLPSISSFVIRFVVDALSQSYRGEIRHVQTHEVVHFQTWDEAVEFIRCYVPLELPINKSPEPPCNQENA